MSVAIGGIARLFTTVLSFPALVALAFSFVVAFSIFRALAILDALLIRRAAAEAAFADTLALLGIAFLVFTAFGAHAVALRAHGWIAAHAETFVTVGACGGRLAALARRRALVSAGGASPGSFALALVVLALAMLRRCVAALGAKLLGAVIALPARGALARFPVNARTVATARVLADGKLAFVSGPALAALALTSFLVADTMLAARRAALLSAEGTVVVIRALAHLLLA